MQTLPAGVCPANPARCMYRVGRVGGGGIYNGHATPRAKQAWVVGNTVSVGFVKNLLVVARILGLVRCDDERQAREA